MTARQALSRDDYRHLRIYFGLKLDVDSRVRLCSHALVNMLRHARGVGDEQVVLAPRWHYGSQTDHAHERVQDPPDDHHGY